MKTGKWALQLSGLFCRKCAEDVEISSDQRSAPFTRVIAWGKDGTVSPSTWVSHSHHTRCLAGGATVSRNHRMDTMSCHGYWLFSFCLWNRILATRVGTRIDASTNRPLNQQAHQPRKSLINAPHMKQATMNRTQPSILPARP